MIVVYVVVGFYLFLSSLLQSLVGFGFSLLALPLILLIEGINPVEAIVICIVSSTIQRLLFIRHMGGHINWKELGPLIPIGLVGLIVGIGLLDLFSNADKSAFKRTIGLLILIVLVVRWCLRIKPTDHLKRKWGQLSAFVSGVLTGFANIGGPPMVMWALSHNWTQERMRTVTIAFSIFFVPFQFLLLWLVFGNTIPMLFVASLTYVPFVLVGSWIGMNLGNRLNAATARSVMYVTLMTICIVSILGG